MPEFGIIRILFFVSYFFAAFSAVTGLLKIVFRENEIIRMLHKMTGPLLNLVYLLFFILAAGALCSKRIALLLLSISFISVVYAGFVTPAHKEKSWVLIGHRVLGLCTFALLTMLLVILLML